MIISIYLSDLETQVADRYAKEHSVSLEDAFKQALFEKIENESRPNTSKIVNDEHET